MSQANGPKIETAAEVAGALDDLPIEPVAAMEDVRQAVTGR
jgi:hypothetical protein